MNPYEQKQDARRERLESAAARAEAASYTAHAAARAATAGIVFGQPILVGHHSEKRHRRDIARSDAAMRKSVEASKQAAELARRAANVGTGGISSDDPDALDKLADKRTDLERERDAMKSANAYYKAHKTLDGWDGPDELAAKGRVTLRVTPYHGAPFPPFSLTNIGARIRQAAKRTATITATRETERTEETVNGCTVTADPDDNRVTLAFPARLDRDAYKVVRSCGFLWSPTRNAFTRKLSNGAMHYAREMATRYGSAK